MAEYATKTFVRNAIQSVGGDGSGDMLKNTYDTNHDGVVNAADSVPWAGVTGKPSAFTPSAHTHTALEISLAAVAASGSYSDLLNQPTIPDELSDLTDDSTHRTVTDAEKSAWNGKQDVLSGDATGHYHTADRNRANHTGTQTASTISDFDTEVSNSTDVAANTSARHAHANQTALDNVSGTNTGDQDLSGYAPLSSPALTGMPTAPTASTGTSSAQIATTAFVQTALSAAGGDMLKSVYDANNDGKVDRAANADSVGGITLWVGTLAEYNALTTAEMEDATMVHCIFEE